MSSDRPSYNLSNLESTPSAVVDKVMLIISVDEKFQAEAVVSGEEQSNAATDRRPSSSENRSSFSSFDLNEVFPPMSELPLMVASTLYDVGVNSAECLEDLELQITSFIIGKLQEQRTASAETSRCRYGLTVIANVEEWRRVRLMQDRDEGSPDDIGANIAARTPSSTTMGAQSDLVKRQVYSTSQRDSEETCPICLSDFWAGLEICRTPCGHYFHPDCVGKWLNLNGTCPLCRFRITS